MPMIELAERRVLPDRLVRFGIRRLLQRRLRELKDYSVTETMAEQLCGEPLAVHTTAANEQHYEVPTAFFERVLGPQLKYSCCLFDSPGDSLADAEQQMLRLTAERAELADGMEILELGCGWGSLSLWMAQQFPNARITAVSNSHGQREFICQRAKQHALKNLNVITQDAREFHTTDRFDRVVSVEMFEHLRNWQELFRRISLWLRHDGKLFFHVFCHRQAPYLFETKGASNWMGRHFFTGGMMPSADLPLQFQEHLAVTQQWQVAGTQYQRTCEVWLDNLDRQEDEILQQMTNWPGIDDPSRFIQRWRMFFMACAELFGFNAGQEWFVSHNLCDRAKTT